MYSLSFLKVSVSSCSGPMYWKQPPLFWGWSVGVCLWTCGLSSSMQSVLNPHCYRSATLGCGVLWELQLGSFCPSYFHIKFRISLSLPTNTSKTAWLGLGGWLSDEEHIFLLQGTRVWFQVGSTSGCSHRQRAHVHISHPHLYIIKK